MAKRFFIGSAIFLLVLLFLWGVYSFFFSAPKQEESPKNETPQPQEETPQPQENTNAVQAVTNTPILSPAISPKDGGTLFYINKNTSTFEKMALSENTVTALSNIPLVSPIAAIWTTDGTKVFVKGLASGYPSFQLFSPQDTPSPVSLKKGVRYLVWDELENNIIYLFQDSSGSVSLNQSLPDGSQWKKITSLSSLGFSISSIPKSPLIAFWETPLNTRVSELKTVNLTNNEVTSLFPGKYGADYLFSPDGNHILMSWAPEKNGSKMSLALLNKNGGEYTDLKFPTPIQKCTWSSDSVTLYCALLGSVPKDASMPDAWLNNSFQSTDTFWKIDTKTGMSTRLIPLENMTISYDASQLLLSPDESKLFFINRKDSKLYSIAL